MAVGGFGGLQFQPGVPQNGSNGNGQTRGRVQEPVQVLSTRLPKFFGSGAIAPAPLLQAQGGMGHPGAQGNVVAQALAQLAGLPPSMSIPPHWRGPDQPTPTFAPLPESGGLPPIKQPMPEPVPPMRPHADMFSQAPSPAPGPLPLPRVIPGKETGEGPAQPVPLPDPFRPPIFPTPPPAPDVQLQPDVQGIQAIADALFRKFQGGQGGF